MKFAVEIAVTKMSTTNYVIEANDLDEARREVEEMLYDHAFTNAVDYAANICSCEDEYTVSDVFEVGNETMTGSFFAY